MNGRKNSYRALAAAFAVSAFRIISSVFDSPATLSAIPIVARTKSSRPRTSNGTEKAARRRSAIARALVSSASSSSRMPNSSPPIRATVSLDRPWNCRRHAVAEDRTVRQPGEGIVERLVRQLFLEELPIGDVARVEHEPVDGRIGGLV